MEKIKNKLLLVAILGSVNFHFATGIFLWYQAEFKPEKEPELLVVEMLDAPMVAKAIPPPAVAPPPPPPRKTLKIEQIVDEAPTAYNDELDPETTQLGAHNHKVDAESIARKIEAIKTAEKPKLKSKKELEEEEMASLPTLGTEDDSEPSSQSDDHLGDKQKKLETLLNTKEFAHFSYYKEIKSQLTRYWAIKIKEKMLPIMKLDRGPATANAQITRLFIILDKNGTLVGVQVLNESGIKDLDDTAISAFKEAAPFPSPPPGILGTDGFVKIRWDFVVETGG